MAQKGPGDDCEKKVQEEEELENEEGKEADKENEVPKADAGPNRKTRSGNKGPKKGETDDDKDGKDYKKLEQDYKKLQDDKVKTTKTITRLNGEIANKNTALANKDTELANKNTELANKDTELANKDTELANKDTEIATKDDTITALQAVINEKKDEEAKAMAEIDNLRKLLSESKTFSDDLVAQLDQAKDRDEEVEEEKKAKILMIMDGNRDEIKDKIDESLGDFTLCEDINSVMDLDKFVSDVERKNSLTLYDMIVILLGSEDVKAKNAAYAYRYLLRSVRGISTSVTIPIAIVQIPPITASGKLTESALFNHKITNIDITGVQIIDTRSKLALYPKGTILSNDGFTISSKGGEIIAESINEQLKVPPPSAKEKKNDSSTHTVSSYDNEWLCEAVELPPESAKHIIGKSGSKINEIQRETGAKLNKTEWKKDKKEVDGVLIRGERNKVRKAREQIKTIIRELKSKGILADEDRSGASPKPKKPKI